MEAREKPALLVMAAGLGSRFGGLKQMAPVDGAGRIIIDYSLHDAKKAGFGKIVCIINPANEGDFRAHFSDGGVEYAHQTIGMLPPGRRAPEGRAKPWGTAHAVLCAKGLVDGDFAVVNADDFYGPGSFGLAHDFLAGPGTEHAVVGYRVENTLSGSGGVTRGVLKVEGGMLAGIQETEGVAPAEGGGARAGGRALAAGTLVSMNMWAFRKSFMDELEARFGPFLDACLRGNPLNGEYLLPRAVGDAVRDGRAAVRVLPCGEKWHGVTYAQDMPGVRAALSALSAGYGWTGGAHVR